jgi:hypothetical protein
MSKPALAGSVFVVAAFAAIVYYSMSGTNVRAEVCMEFNGHTACKTVSGDTREHVIQTARTGACAEISGGVTDTIRCEHETPKSITWK